MIKLLSKWGHVLGYLNAIFSKIVQAMFYWIHGKTAIMVVPPSDKLAI